MFDAADRAYMAQAMQLAQRGRFSTSSNPRVGCLLVRNGRVIGRGWHQWAGEGHAEVNAIADARAAGETPEGTTAYVTLEPCSHRGKTPPCCEGLLAAGVSRVVAAMQDPNPLVAGRGLQFLQQRGVEVSSGLLEEQARALNPGFIKRMEQGLPYVRVKLAMSVDGRTAMASGESKWITGPAARRDVQHLRAASCAILTGAGTIVHDDASMTVRLEEAGPDFAELIARRQPLRVVLDSQQRVSRDAKIWQQPGESLWVSTQSQANLPDSGRVSHWQASANEQGQVDLRVLMQHLAERQCNEILVEAGAELAGAMLQQGLVDELVVYMAPKLLGSDARPLLTLPLATMAEAVAVEFVDTRVVGDDLRLTLKPSSTQ